ncbi:NUDIX domain-containing protein [Devosia sp. RR2S18]|uniref:NUDIX domain-containing protein n=1 Tax=Devosia rhizosphaerae TaxID=3049774 RepID=UPI00253F74AF|nr:NUDIX domain-containing protein [Devosia sp. RR2S18]WIJ26590.1 NUDIX domain-containing protein [Devosia sp. RR2S18]
MGEFADSYLGRLRAAVGTQLLLVPGVRIVLENAAGEVLLDLRADNNLWALPGGACEPGEAAMSSIAREVLEEAGVTLEDATPFGFASDPHWELNNYPNGDTSQNFCLMFTSTSFSGSPRPVDGEAKEYLWCAPEKLPAQMVPHHRRSVEAWLRWKEGGGFQLI